LNNPLLSQKRISYILTTKNRAAQLELALIRYKKIIKEEDELIIIDGGSTDDTKSVINKFSKLIDYFISEPDQNANEATNKGFLVANGKYIKQIADDDIYFEEGLDKAYEIMEKNQDIDMIVCGGIRKQGEKETLIYVPPGSDYGSSVDNIFINGYPLSGMGVFFNRSLLSRVGLFETNEPFSDMGFILRSIYLGAKVKFCRINLFFHELSDNSVTIKDEKKYNKQYKILLNRYCSDRYKRIYRLKNMFWYKILRIIPKIFVSLISIKKNDDYTITPIWDEGFS